MQESFRAKLEAADGAREKEALPSHPVAGRVGCSFQTSSAGTSWPENRAAGAGIANYSMTEHGSMRKVS